MLRCLYACIDVCHSDCYCEKCAHVLLLMNVCKCQSVLELYILYILLYFTMQAIMQPSLGFTLIKLAQGTIKEMQLRRTKH